MIFKFQVCQGLNSHYFHIVGDGKLNPIVGVYISIIRILIESGMTIPNIATFDHGTCKFSTDVKTWITFFFFSIPIGLPQGSHLRKTRKWNSTCAIWDREKDTYYMFHSSSFVWVPCLPDIYHIAHVLPCLFQSAWNYTLTIWLDEQGSISIMK